MYCLQHVRFCYMNLCLYDTDIMQDNTNNNNVIDLNITLVQVTVSLKYIAWATKNMMSDLMIFNKVFTFTNINYKIRLNLERAMLHFFTLSTKTSI